MRVCRAAWNTSGICWLLAVAMPAVVHAQEFWRHVGPEQLRMEIRRPSSLPTARLPDLPPPLNVSNSPADAPQRNLSLDEAIRTALANSEVIRVLSGFSASSTGQTVYDPAIANTQIDQARARFDPALTLRNDFTRGGAPGGTLIAAPPLARLGAVPTHDYDMSLGLSKTERLGGTGSLNFNVHPSRAAVSGLPLNPNTRSSIDMAFTQPLLRGAGTQVNLAPVMIARIGTERSFFQMKDGVQQLVRSVIEGYWGLVSARTDVWARQQQVAQGEHAFNQAKARMDAGSGSAGDLAQARASLASFRAALISARANVLQREAALANVLGMPPSGQVRVVPVTPPSFERLDINWDGVLRVAEEFRPDLIELKLAVEAGEQRLLQARNLAMPQVDATALYRWDGLGGRTPDGSVISSYPGQFTGWLLGVNVSMPMGLRQSRAAMRQEELTLMRDRANLQQGLHNATHQLATSYRNLAQFHEEYLAFKEARRAARINLDMQFARYKMGLSLFLDVLQAISNWGNNVSSESRALVSYNAELANLQALTGTILEEHGVWFAEEGYRSIGPWGRMFEGRCYPKDRRPGPNADNYENTAEPAENAFDLSDPLQKPPDAGRIRIEIPERIPIPPPQG